jgi:hypothetical protein
VIEVVLSPNHRETEVVPLRSPDGFLLDIDRWFRSLLRLPQRLAQPILPGKTA